MNEPSPIISTQWLADRLGQPDVKVVDGSWYLKAAGRDAAAEYTAGHIPGAVRFDIDVIKDTSSHLPHMLADPLEFAATVGAMGISDRDTIVVYDGSGLFSAGRVWWNFKIMGAAKVYVLSGGLPKWKNEGRPLTGEIPAPTPAVFNAVLRSELVANADDVLAALDVPDTHQVVDVRQKARYLGEAPEPREGVRKGHMPGSLNLPFAELIVDGELKDAETLRARIAQAGIDLNKPVTASCGSGVTASVFALTLAHLGVDVVRVYDGSWTEWGTDTRLPVVKG